MPLRQLIERLESGLRTATFDDLRETSLPPEPVLKTAGERDVLAVRCMLAEVRDYFGLYEEARELLAVEGPRAIELLRVASPPRTEEERRLLKQHVWAAMQWCLCCHRRNDYDQILKYLRRCGHVLKEFVRHHGDPCRGTFCRLFYLFGLVHRQLYAYDNAAYCFATSIKYAWQEFESKIKPALGADLSPSPTPNMKALTHWSVAKCLALGLGWIYYTQARLDNARAMLLAAKLLLEGTNDVVITAYVDIIHGCILRASRQKRDNSNLNQAIQTLSKSYDVFFRVNHIPYRIRAATELGLAYLYAAQHHAERATKDANLQSAEKYIDEAQNLAFNTGDTRWVSNALIVKSRLARERYEYDQAVSFANEAMKSAKGDLFAQVDALIARAEAQLARRKVRLSRDETHLAEQDLKRAIYDLTQARDLGGRNRKVDVVTSLHLAATYLVIGDNRKAAVEFERARKFRAEVHNAFLTNLYAAVDKELANIRQDFVIPFSAEHLNKDKQLELQQWLVKWARYNFNTDRAAAHELEIALPTYYSWRSSPKERHRKKRDRHRKGEKIETGPDRLQ